MFRKTLVKALAFDHIQVSLRSKFIDCNLLALIVIYEAVGSLQFCISRPIVVKTKVGCWKHFVMKRRTALYFYTWSIKSFRLCRRTYSYFKDSDIWNFDMSFHSCVSFICFVSLSFHLSCLLFSDSLLNFLRYWRNL